MVSAGGLRVMSPIQENKSFRIKQGVWAIRKRQVDADVFVSSRNEWHVSYRAIGACMQISHLAPSRRCVINSGGLAGRGISMVIPQTISSPISYHHKIRSKNLL